MSNVENPNANANVEAGETDPRNADSDFDGLSDGDDPVGVDEVDDRFDSVRGFVRMEADAGPDVVVVTRDLDGAQGGLPVAPDVDESRDTDGTSGVEHRRRATKVA